MNELRRGIIYNGIFLAGVTGFVTFLVVSTIPQYTLIITNILLAVIIGQNTNSNKR